MKFWIVPHWIAHLSSKSHQYIEFDDKFQVETFITIDITSHKNSVV